jgi:DNA helicase-2/ATP-dependent DNA helicase PcrA
MNLTALNDRQREAVCAADGPVLVLAGAGSGKTRVLTERVAYLVGEMGVHPLSILAITFTNKAAAEMRERIQKTLDRDVSDMWISTFHSMCVRILRISGQRIGYGSNFVIYDTDDSLRLIKQILENLGLKEDKNYPPKLIRNIISKYKNTSADKDIYDFAEKNYPMQSYRISDIYKMYSEEMLRQNAMDFDDLLLNTLKLLIQDEESRLYYQNRFKYVMVDEYQDTNTVQYRLTKLLCGRYRNIFVVGDDDQSIYAFRGANIQNILNFEKDYPNAKVIRLEQNYRSDIRILNAANCVIKNNQGRTRKTLWSDITGGGKPKLFTAPSERDEAEYIAREINSLVRQGGRYGDVAVLYRIHTLARVIEEKLRMYAVPYRVYGGISFYERKEIKEMLAYLNLVANPASDVHFLRIINVPKRGIGAATVQKIMNVAHSEGISCMDVVANASLYFEGQSFLKKLLEFSRVMKELQESAEDEEVHGVIRDIYEKTGYREMLETEYPEDFQTRKENVEELINSAYEFEKNGGEGLIDYLQNIALITDLDSMDEQGGVTLMTIHAAKGLEFDTVFVAGMEETLFPSRMAVEEGNVEEERRLCYVAITRAKKSLYLTNAMRRSYFGEFAMNPPSRFLEEIDNNLVEYLNKPSQNAFVTKQSAANKPPAPPRFTGRPVIQEKKPQEVSADYKVGVVVAHKTFGRGPIVAISGEGNQKVATVEFDIAGTKKMFLSFASLEIVR